MSLNQKILLLLAVFCLVGGMVWSQRKSQLKDLSEIAKNTNIIPVEKRAPAQDNRRIEENVNPTVLHQREMANLLADAGMAKFRWDLTHGRQLTVHFKIEERCYYGDWDAIMEDMKSSTGKKLLLTVEPMGKPKTGGFVPIVLPISQDKFGTDFTMNINLPPIHKAIEIGVFVCKDDTNTRGCVGKPVADIDGIMGRFTKKSESNQTKASIDVIYVYHYLLLEPDGIVSFCEDKVSGKSYDLLKDYLAKTRYPNESKLDSVRSTNDKLRSVIPTLNSQGLAVVLPKVMPKCDFRRLAGSFKQGPPPARP